MTHRPRVPSSDLSGLIGSDLDPSTQEETPDIGKRYQRAVEEYIYLRNQIREELSRLSSPPDPPHVGELGVDESPTSSRPTEEEFVSPERKSSPSQFLTPTPTPTPRSKNWRKDTDSRTSPPTSEMVTFEAPRFEGLPGEDPQDYIDDVGIYVEESSRTRSPGAREANGGADPTKGDPDEAKKRSVFRRGLRGDAREWYQHLPANKRGDYNALQDGLKKRFPLRIRNHDVGLGARIDGFDRKVGESLAEYIGRANKLSLRANDDQLDRLRERLYKNICGGDHPQDERIQERVTDRLVNAKFLTNFGEFEKCTYQDVEEILIACALKPGKEGDFLDQVELGMARPQKKLSEGEFLRELGSTITDSLKKFRMEAQQMTPPVQETIQPPVNSFPLQTYGALNPSYFPRPPYHQPASHHNQPYFPWGDHVYEQSFIPDMTGAGPIQGRDPNNQGPPYYPSQDARNPQTSGPSNDSGGKMNPRGAGAGGNRGNRGGYGGRGGYRNSGYERRQLICWNCGIEGHSAPDCTKVQRPWQEKNQIRDAVLNGQPLPAHLRYDLPEAGSEKKPTGEVPPNTQPANTGKIVGEDGELSVDLDYLTEEERRFIGMEWPDVASSSTSPIFTPSEEDEETIYALPSDPKKRKMNDDGSPVSDAGMYEPPLLAPPPPPREEPGRKPPERQAPRADSPHPRKATRPLIPNEKLRDQLTRRLVEAKRVIQKRDTVPIRAYENNREDRIDIGHLLRTTPFPRITWGQLLDRSPTIRAQLTREMGLSPTAKLERPRPLRKKKGHHSAMAEPQTLRTMVATTVHKDKARMDDGRTHLGYIDGAIHGNVITRILVDGGALADLMSPACATQNNLSLRPVPKPLELKMADDSTTPIEYYVVFPLVVGEILSVIRAYIVGNNQTYEILLSKAWLRRNSAIVDYGTDHITLRGLEGVTSTLTMRDAPAVGPMYIQEAERGPGLSPSTLDDSSSETGQDSEESDSDPEWDEDDIPDRGPTNKDLIEEMLNIAELALATTTSSKN